MKNNKLNNWMLELASLASEYDTYIEVWFCTYKVQHKYRGLSHLIINPSVYSNFIRIKNLTLPLFIPIELIEELYL